YCESGGAGGLELADAVAALCEKPSNFTTLYPLEMPIREKLHTIATKIYGADGVECAPEAEKQLQQLETLGYGALPVCVAKTPASLSDNPKLAGRPRGFTISVSSFRVSAGAGFVVAYTGKIMTMPGLPKRPSALAIDIDDQGNIAGLF
ncbi:MAG: formate--tetrahydrofolate ligase, partial [Spirochaetes bacterium]|nr:formate--tetrahydrofolate ligase [Spirochaetota bacterium]